MFNRENTLACLSAISNASAYPHGQCFVPLAIQLLQSILSVTVSCASPYFLTRLFRHTIWSTRRCWWRLVLCYCCQVLLFSGCTTAFLRREFDLKHGKSLQIDGKPAAVVLSWKLSPAWEFLFVSSFFKNFLAVLTDLWEQSPILLFSS